MIRILQATCESRLFFYIYPTLIRTLSPSTLIRISLFFESKEFKEFREQCLFIPASLNLKHSSMHLSLSCAISILVVDDIHMVVMGLLLIFGERCLGLSIFYATFVSYYYRWQTPLCM